MSWGIKEVASVGAVAIALGAIIASRERDLWSAIKDINRVQERLDENFSEHTRIWAEVLRHGALLSDIDVIKLRGEFSESQFKAMALDDKAQWAAIRELENRDKQ